MFHDAGRALDVARQRLQGFVQHPQRHARYAAKVLLKYKLLEWQQLPLEQVQAWCAQTPYMGMLHAQYFDDQPWSAWLHLLLQELVGSGAAVLELQDGIAILRNH